MTLRRRPSTAPASRPWFRPGLAVLLAASLFGACGGPEPSPLVSAAGPVCRVGADGGPMLAERGIGGTGAPVQTADRGIGGTGVKSDGTVYGVLGVITGFASICVAGLDVAVADGLPVVVDGMAASPAALRAGQVARIEVVEAGVQLQARRVLVLTEATGQVANSAASALLVAGGTGALLVAGQTVVLTSSTLGETEPPPGAWVAISGLRTPEGAIVATRIDRVPPGQTAVRGPLVRTGNAWRIGGLELRLPADGRLLTGHAVSAIGEERDGVLYPSSVVPDPAAMDPAATFDPQMPILALESYGSLAGNRLVLQRLEGVLGADRGSLRQSAVEITRRPDGSLAAVFMRRDGRDRGPNGGFGGRPPGQAGQGMSSVAPGPGRGGARSADPASYRAPDTASFARTDNQVRGAGPSGRLGRPDGLSPDPLASSAGPIGGPAGGPPGAPPGKGR